MLYDYTCSDCKTTFERNLSIAGRKAPESEPCPNCGNSGNVKQAISSLLICDPIRMGRKKPAAGFNEVLRNIKKASPGSNMNIRD